MAVEPMVRALATQVALEEIDRLRPEQRDAILRDAGELPRVREAFQFSWIPLATHMRLLEAMRRHLPKLTWIDSQQKLTRGYLEKPVLRGLFDTAIRVLGLSVSSLLKWTPRAYEALFKDAGRMELLPGHTDTEATLVLDGFPPGLFASGTFAESMRASLEVTFDLARSRGTVAMVQFDPAVGRATYQLRWQPG